MVIAYGLISRELVRGMSFESNQSKETTGESRHTVGPKGKGLFVRCGFFSHRGSNPLLITFMDLHEVAANSEEKI